jgi:hypothetical protein
MFFSNREKYRNKKIIRILKHINDLVKHINDLFIKIPFFYNVKHLRNFKYFSDNIRLLFKFYLSVDDFEEFNFIIWLYLFVLILIFKFFLIFKFQKIT